MKWLDINLHYTCLQVHTFHNDEKSKKRKFYILQKSILCNPHEVNMTIEDDVKFNFEDIVVHFLLQQRILNEIMNNKR